MYREQRKSSHGQAFDFEQIAEAVDEQIASWPRHALFRWVPPAATSTNFRLAPAVRPLSPAPQPPIERPAAHVDAELKALFAREPALEQDAKDAVRAAFRDFLEHAPFTCHRCG